MSHYGALVLVLALTACCNQSPQSAAPPTAAPQTAAPQTAEPVEESILRDPHRFDCTTDSDCGNSCAYGAVNTGWYARAEVAPGFSECEDGCNNQISAPPRCESGSCVAYQADPQEETKISPRPSCTRIDR